MLPMTGFIPGINPLHAYASGEPGSYDYQPMPENYAKAFIGLLYDTSNVTDEMMSAGDIYTFLTGGFEKGSEEELIAKIAFIETAGINLEKCASKYSTMLNNSYDQLLSYLEKKAGGNLAESIINSTLKKIVRSVAQVIVTFSSNAGDEIWEDVEFISNTYSTISGIPGKIRSVKNDVRALINTFSYAWSSSKTNLYTYLHDYIENKYCEDMLSDIGISDLISDVNAINRYELANSGVYDPILNWASDDNVAVLEYFGDFIFAVGKSVEVQLSSDDPDNIKVMEVHCPTDVYLYDAGDELVLSIVSDKVTKADNLDIYALVYNSQKTIIVPSNTTYRLEIVGTDNGLMNYNVKEFSDDMQMREVRYTDVPLLYGLRYNAEINTEIYTESSNYNLVQEDGGEIGCDYDSLLPLDSDVVDVIVSEELFEGFSTELIDTVADAMFNMRPSVDISSYLITVDDIMGLFSAVQKYYPSEYSIMSKTDFSYKAIVNPTKRIVTSLRFYYDSEVSLSVYQKRVRDLQIEIDKIVAMTEGMSDFEKILFVHDYIVLNCEYDYDLLEMLNNQGGRLDGEIRSERYTEYSVLVNGTGICGSYALAYRAVLNAAGVECLYLSSAEMNHAWNLVKIDGNWYHCDLTWDDTGYGNDYHYGIAERTYFLRTDAEIMQLNHRTWTPGQYKATSEAFSDMPRYEDYKQKYDGGNWYYLKSGKIYSSDIDGNDETEITEVMASSIDVENGEIYYANGKNILHYISATNDSNYAYVLPASKAGDEPSRAIVKNFYINDNDVTLFIKGDFLGKSQATKIFDILKEASYEEISGLSLSETELILDVFDSSILTADILATIEIEGLEIHWTSDNSTIASVDQNGCVLGRNDGETTIHATCLDFVASCSVIVNGDGLSGMCGENVRWDYDSDSRTLVFSGSGYMYYDEYPFYIRKEVVHAKVNDGIESIESFSFDQCYNLEDVYIGNSVKIIGGNAFSNCPKLTELDFPDSVELILASAFCNSNNLKKIKLGANTRIDEINTFNDMYGLEEILVSEDNSYYKSIDGVLFNSSIMTLIKFPTAKNITKYTVPSGVKTIGPFAFEDSRLKEVVLSESVEEVDFQAFAYTNIENIVLNEGLLRIQEDAFRASDKIKTIYIPSTVVTIASTAFTTCYSLTEINVSSLNANYISDNYGVLYSNNFEMLIAYPAGRSDVSYPVANGTKRIFEEAFRGRSLVDVSLPDGLRRIDSYAFRECRKLQNINLPESLEYIGNGAFASCYSLQNVYIPSTVTTIPNSSDTTNTFYGVGNVIYHGTNQNAPWGAKALNGYVVNNLIYSDADCEILEGCCATETGIVKLPSSCKSISDEAFAGCSDIKGIVLNDETTTIGTYMFGYSANKTDLDYIIFGTGISNISDLSNFGSYKINIDKWVIKNAECTINTDVIPKTVYGHTGSTAQAFAQRYNLKFVDMDAEPHEHDYFLMDQNEKTEDADGLEYWECYCSESSYEVIDHNFTEEVNTATCAAGGVNKQVCSVCGNENIIEETPALGHDWVEVSRTEGNCITPAEITFKCSRCDETTTGEADPASGHEYISRTIASTCANYGYTIDTCVNCGEELLYDFTSPLGHKLNIATTENCSAHGSYIYSCARCDYHEEVAIEASNLETDTVTVPATCTIAGSEKQVCVFCGATVSTTILPATGHSFDADYTTDVPATCTSEGIKSRHCTKCGQQILTELIEAKGHSFGEWTIKTASTCTDAGVEQRVCANDPEHVETRPIDPKGHSFGEWTIKTAPTCTDAGVEQRICANDPEHVETRPINPKGHSFGDWTLIDEPTCTENGLEQRVCSNDPEHIETRPIAATGHADPDGDGICNACGAVVNNGGGSSSGSGKCKWCGQRHTGFFGSIVAFFHNILYFFAHLFGRR